MQEQLQSKTAALTHCLAGAQEQFVPYCCASAPIILTCLTLHRINWATAVVACLPDFAAYINDDGQGGTAGFVSLDKMLTGSAPKGKFEQLASGSHFHTLQTCSRQTAKI